ncbi:hypothetical protein GAMM_50009 [Gammaproteobacteria bacterium]
MKLKIKNSKDATDSLKKEDVVVVGNSKLRIDSIMLSSLFQGEAVKTYYSSELFLENLPRYAKDAKICIDRDLIDQKDKKGFAKQLHEAGCTNLHWFSGSNFREGESPEVTALIGCTEGDFR